MILLMLGLFNVVAGYSLIKFETGFWYWIGWIGLIIGAGNVIIFLNQ